MLESFFDGISAHLVGNVYVALGEEAFQFDRKIQNLNFDGSKIA